MAGPHNHARLHEIEEIIRLSSVPVGIAHHRHCIAVRIGGSHSPDEWRRTLWVYALTSRPETESMRRLMPLMVKSEAISQCAV